MKEIVPRALAGERVDRVVALLTGLPRSEVAELVTAGRVQVNAKTVASRAYRVEEGEVLEVELPPVKDARLLPDRDVPFEVVHADEDVIVVDKPAGVVVHPGAGQSSGTLVHGLLHRFPEVAAVGDPTRPGIVHRLDKGTSGLLVVARTPAAHAVLVDQLQARTVERSYLALSAQAQAAVEEIDRALEKIAAGTYGLCEQCGQPIPKARLRALPYAALCVACKSGGLSRR